MRDWRVNPAGREPALEDREVARDEVAKFRTWSWNGGFRA
ncbi:hypothetical protein Pd630_LPD09033 (plasmid) [Rhodococcus opacus PD630]|nr:hypothetical protein Pd630_LPD09033 [Rhodococcus opacus PD630]